MADTVKKYKKTLVACYLGFITQAIAANFAPLLFLKFHNDYGIPLGKIALISAVFFITQLIVDVLCAQFADRIGYRKCVVASEVFAAAGLVGLAFLPELLPALGAGQRHRRDGPVPLAGRELPYKLWRHVRLNTRKPR